MIEGTLSKAELLGNLLKFKEDLIKMRAATEEIIETAALEVETLSIRLAKATDELAERDASFEVRWDADMRAIKRWRAERPVGRDLILPDHADLCVWLMFRVKYLENDGMLNELAALGSEDLERIRDACQGQLDDLKDTWDDADKNCP